MLTPVVSIVMGSISDLTVVRKAADFLNSMAVPFEMSALSTHRAPAQVEQFAKSAARRGIKVIIAAAGMAAPLPGMIASMTSLPVIGIPINVTMGGTDALYSMVQMPAGVPVATVGINASLNAAILATQIIALTDQTVARRLSEYRMSLSEKVLKANNEISLVEYEYKTN